MKKKLVFKALSLIILGISLLPLSCEQAEKPLAGTPLAKVGKSYLYEQDVLRRLPDTFDDEQKNNFIVQFREQWVRRELIAQEASRSGLAEQEELKLKIVFLGFGLDSDNLHSPNEKYDIVNFYKGIETIPYFHKYFSEI